MCSRIRSRGQAPLEVTIGSDVSCGLGMVTETFLIRIIAARYEGETPADIRSLMLTEQSIERRRYKRFRSLSLR